MRSRRKPVPAELLELQARLEEHLATARQLARDLDLAGTSEPVLDRTLVVDRALGVARALALDLDRDRDLDVDRDLARTRVLVLDLDRAIDRARVLAGIRDLGFDRDFASDLDRAIERVSRVVGELESVLARVAGKVAVDGSLPVVVPRMVVRPARAAVRVSRWAARLLPSSGQARYADELLDELYDMANDGVGRWSQLACALRQVVPGVWRLRTALRQERQAPRVSREGP